MNKILLSLRYIFIVLGALAALFVVLSFTDVPYYAYHNLGMKNAGMNVPPDYIVVMGAGGMPSPEGLMRCDYTAQAAKKWLKAKIIIAMPTDPAYFRISHPYKMFRQIERYGIDSTRFLFQTNGMNTRQQARAIAESFPEHDTLSVMIVTSPQHLYRSVKVFEKTGFAEVGGLASFEKAIEEQNLITKDSPKDEISNLNLRYNMWNYMKYQIIVLREYAAITYYWLKGWI
ncbi:MAG: YdcF family protein [Bacteroidota bacterium]